MLRYRFRELSVVTDETIEKLVNENVAGGYRLDGIHFVTTEASRRPAMAFVAFVREVAEGEGAGAGETGAAGESGSDDSRGESGNGDSATEQ
jgi:hypothetical protein